MPFSQSAQLRRFSIVVLVVASVTIFVSYRNILGTLYDYQEKANPETSEIETKTLQTASYKSLWDVSNDLKNYWLYFRTIINQKPLQSEMENIDNGYDAINGAIRKLIISSSTYRKHELGKLSKFIREKIGKLQNPNNCDKASLLLTDVTLSNCGFRCTLHSIVQIFIHSFMDNRTLVLQSKGWRYAPEGWEYAFQSPSRCEYDGNLSMVPRMRGEGDGRVVKMSSRNTTIDKWIHWSVPKELSSTLKELHGQPYVWWVAQFTSYLFKLQPWLDNEFQQISESIGFSDSVVGIQVRWGDKIKDESIKHEVWEYMHFVERWYDQLENQGKSANRTVFVAYEDPAVWTQLKQKYPKYTLIASQRINSVVTGPQRRRHEGLKSVLADIYFLSRCSYLVCTLSSNVCRTAYELMMNYRADASVRFQSVDTLYRLKAIKEQPWIAIMDHESKKPQELQFRKGDEIIVNIDPHIPMNDGFMRGLNKRTKKNGTIPTFKVREKVMSYRMPAF